MAYLSLSDDELALLRFTCDLFFVEESPLYYLEAEAREPVDYEGTYQSLIDKDVIDPHGFRITDDALNRLAPLTECDGRVVHLVQRPGRPAEHTDYYVLDEIAVEYVRGEDAHAVGEDLDPDELTEHLARRLVPRKAAGDLLDLTLTTHELLALSVLARVSSKEAGFAVDEEAARAHLADAQLSEPTVVSGPPALSKVSVRAAGVAARVPEPSLLVTDTRIDLASGLVGLVAKGAVRVVDGVVTPRPALRTLLEGISSGERHTFVRHDFGEDEWLTRETTLFATDGGLFSLRLDGDGSVRLEEVDGARARAALARAVGTLPRDQRAPEPRPLRDLLLGVEPGPRGRDG